MPVRRTAFEGLLEAVADAMVGVDRAGVVRIINHQAEVLFGYDREELVGQPIEMLMPESLRQVHRAHVAGYVTGLEPRAMGTGLDRYHGRLPLGVHRRCLTWRSSSGPTTPG